MVVPPTVSQVIPQVPSVRVPLLHITSVASMANVAASLISQQSPLSFSNRLTYSARNVVRKIIQPCTVIKR